MWLWGAPWLRTLYLGRLRVDFQIRLSTSQHKLSSLFHRVNTNLRRKIVNTGISFFKMSTTTLSISIELQNRISPTLLAQSITPLEAPLSHSLSQNGRTEHTEIEQRVLEPVDRGAAAWRLLGVAFIFEALLWGKHTIIKSRKVLISCT